MNFLYFENIKDRSVLEQENDEGGSSGKIIFNKESKACLWEFIIVPHLREGVWEGTDPQGHHKFWEGLKVELGTEEMVEISKEPERQRYNLVGALFDGGYKNSIIVMGRLGKGIGRNYKSVIEELDVPLEEIIRIPIDVHEDEDIRKVDDILDDPKVTDVYVNTEYDEEEAKEDLQAIEDLLKAAQPEEE